MFRSPLVALGVVLAALAVVVDAGAGTERRAGSTRLTVGSSTELEQAIGALRHRGGTVVLRPRLYRELVIRWRSRKLLRIIGTRGTRVERVVFDGASRVSFGKVTIGPIRGEAMVDVRSSRNIVLHDLVVTARGTRHRSFEIGRAHV